MSSSSLNYQRLMDTTWDILHASIVKRETILSTLPEEERNILSKAIWPGFDIELARRRKTVNKILLSLYPVTYFAYIGQEGAEGVMRLLESKAWLARQAKPGSAYPATATTAIAFQQFLSSGKWIEQQPMWIQQAWEFECTYLFNTSIPLLRYIDEYTTVRLSQGTWVAEAPFNVLLAGKKLRESGKEYPWYDALYFFKPLPFPCAILSQQKQNHIQRVRLTDSTLETLRWLWNMSEEVPSDILSTPVFRYAYDKGFVEILEKIT